MAITIDDYNLKDTPLFSMQDSDQKMRTALRKHSLIAGAFPSGKYAARAPVKAALAAWSDEGHVIGNHSHAHSYYSGKDPEKDAVIMVKDLRQAEAVLSGYPTYKKWYRFPYLAEGRTAKGRDQARKHLARAGYTNAHVTIDASDWYIADALIKRLRRDKSADIAPYRKYYLDHLWDRANYYNTLAFDLTGRKDISHTLLIHHNIASALFLDDTLSMFKSKGWGLSNIEDAYRDKIFTNSPDSLPAGQSLVWALAKADGGYEDRLRYPAEDGRYEKQPMIDAGLL